MESSCKVWFTPCRRRPIPRLSLRLKRFRLRRQLPRLTMVDPPSWNGASRRVVVLVVTYSVRGWCYGG
ncbi:hypothetical protein Taro_005864 [Colocasia esculenta]|uniref:Uncharacterized protein n=1 Tax=Colocasia esculenta TaxID=4460 RepID=A0A843TTM9_COLES|nr:hypothetical protein [Colocasia esculenta]